MNYCIHEETQYLTATRSCSLLHLPTMSYIFFYHLSLIATSHFRVKRERGNQNLSRKYQFKKVFDT